MTKEQKQNAKKLFLALYLQQLAQSQLTCGGRGGGGTSWKKC